MAKGNSAKEVLNGFSAAEIADLSELTLDTINYLAREGYLRPAYARGKVRGRVRYYSYRDLVVARVIRKLTATGLELKRLKHAIKLLSRDDTWQKSEKFHLLSTDGKQVYYHLNNGSLLDLAPGLQHSFAFVLDLAATKAETKRIIDEKKRRRFSLANEPLVFEALKKATS